VRGNALVIGAVAVISAALGASPAPAAAADPLGAVKASCQSRQSADAPPARRARYRICSGMVESFDGTPLDVTVTLPARRSRRALPLVVFLHGFLNSKGEYLSETRAGTGPDRGGDAYKTVQWNNVWFASRGYAVLNYSARGQGESGGSIDLASRHTEVRDTHHLTGLLADDSRTRGRLARIHPRRVAALGGSYGGGQTWLLLSTRGRGARQYGSWVSPRGRGLRLAAAVPQFTWSDLLQSLAPNGRAGNSPFGIGKFSIVNGLVASAGAKVPPKVLGWIGRLNAGEPYDAPADPVVPEAKRALTQDRSAIHQHGFFRALRGRRQRAVPVLAAQGWTDPIFPAGESLRMYSALRAARRGYPVGLYFGDFEHLTAAVKIPDFAYYHRLGNRMLDHYLRRRGRRPRLDVRSARTRCEKDLFGPVTRARRWSLLGPRALTLDFPGSRQILAPLADPRAIATDPVAVSTRSGRGCVSTTLPPTPGVATWTAPVPRGFTMIGMPRLSLRLRAVAPDVQLNARLWDVAPGGAQTLVTRGAYRAVAPSPAGEGVRYDLFGNHWRFDPGHRLMLEVTADDSPFLRRDNFPALATIDRVRVVVPGRP
jgi:predicted acyl esterase